MPRRHPIATSVLLLLAFAAPVVACLWDYDTLRTEATGLPGIAEIITGRFERNPPLYYEMRLQRSRALIEADAHDWDAYDNAGVACDRLGRYDEAIDWMVRKHEAMDSALLDEQTAAKHRYRYLANLGTFYAHRWLSAGAHRDDVGDMKRGIELIEAAIELNPDAHFGRERYQLLAMQWMVDPPELYSTWALPPIYAASPSFELDYMEHGRKLTGYLKASGFDDAVHGVSGLIALGNAWESVDIFYALLMALSEDQQSALARLARLRIDELIRAGRRSLHPEAPDDETELGEIIWIPSWRPYGEEEIDAFYAKARAAAEAWHEHRTQFMLTRLESGRHPDTDPSFWEGYEPLPAVNMPHGAFGTGMHSEKLLRTTSGILLVVLIPLGVCLVIRFHIRALRALKARNGV